ncbi:MAG: hypothetical protein HOV77_06550 [Hamadaea sp.]|uniref:hypothetical protein n=1 Tax=Hamadaea sp. TaxID=2024425 RepID=UPI0017D7B6A5|nr:hypothetical protein [Hamadaea sp.]NUT18826.1 hypothetical protein [Hamadaea sp.]
MNRREVSKFGVTALVAIMTAALPAACGSDGDAGTMSLSVREPAADATVTVPFAVAFDSSVPLGDEASGLHHVHLYFDDNSNDYLIVESTSVQVTNAPPGRHVMHLSLRNANHSAAGVETQVTLIVSGTPGPSSPAPQPSASSDGGGYGY